MAKTIKFNLICDKNPVRTLEDLRNNFCIEDVLIYYNNKLLHRWLNVRGYNEQLKEVEAISTTNELDIIRKLINIFEVETDEQKVEENIYILKYKQEEETKLEEYKKMNYEISSIISDYHSEYEELIDTIVENKDNMAQIKSAIKEIATNYKELFILNYKELFYRLLENAPMAIFVMLMNEDMRYCYLPKDDTENINEDKKSMYNNICNLLEYENLVKILSDNLKEFSGDTDSYWDDIETKDKQYMILKIEQGNFVREAGKKGGDLDTSQINNKFVILSGIDYKSNNSKDKLLYLEV